MPASACASASTPDRSTRDCSQKYGKATPEALAESARWEASLFEEHDFHDFKISVKHNDPVIMVQAYRLLAAMGDWPLHLGVTEAGPAFQGTIKSATAFGILLGEGIGDTIRVSLSAPPAEEVKVGHQILQSLNLRERKLEIVSCPSCGRAQVDVYTLADDVTEGLKDMTVPLRVAVMGCVVNGPGEAREADLGVASGNGKGQIFVKGQVIKTVPEADIVATLIEEANRLAAEMGPDAGDRHRAGRHELTPGIASAELRPERVVRVDRRLPAEVGVQHVRVRRDVAVAHEVDQAGERLALVDGVGDHRLELCAERHRLHRRVDRDAVQVARPALEHLDLVVAQLPTEFDQLGGVPGDARDLLGRLVERGRRIDPEHPALAPGEVLQRGEAGDHAGVGRAGHRADDDRVERDAERLLLLGELERPVREAEPAERVLGGAGGIG